MITNSLFNNEIKLEEEKFPTDLKNKINLLIEKHFNKLKYNNYEIKFRLDTSEVLFKFDFDCLDVVVSLNYLFILDNNIEMIFDIMCKLIEQKFKDLWYKED